MIIFNRENERIVWTRITYNEAAQLSDYTDWTRFLFTKLVPEELAGANLEAPEQTLIDLQVWLSTLRYGRGPTNSTLQNQANAEMLHQRPSWFGTLQFTDGLSNLMLSGVRSDKAQAFAKLLRQPGLLIEALDGRLPNRRHGITTGVFAEFCANLTVVADATIDGGLYASQRQNAAYCRAEVNSYTTHRNLRNLFYREVDLSGFRSTISRLVDNFASSRHISPKLVNKVLRLEATR
jgi:hypothetical protein